MLEGAASDQSLIKKRFRNFKSTQNFLVKIFKSALSLEISGFSHVPNNISFTLKEDMDSHTRSDIDALHSEIRDLKEKNSQMELRLLQIEAEIKKQTQTKDDVSVFNENLKAGQYAMVSMLHEYGPGWYFHKGPWGIGGLRHCRQS